MSIFLSFLILILQFDLLIYRLEIERTFLFKYLPQRNMTSISNLVKNATNSGFKIAPEIVLKSNYKNYCSWPFSQILEKSIKAFPYNKTLSQANLEIAKLQGMEIDKVSDYFANLNIESISEYWYNFYVLSNIALKGKRSNNLDECNLELNNANGDLNKQKCKNYKYNKWKKSKENNNSLSQNQDEFYKMILDKEEEFSEKLNRGKRRTLKLLINKFQYEKRTDENKNSYLINGIKNLNSFKQTLQLRKYIQTLPFYRKIDRHFPKGILTHIHWPGAFTGETVYKAILNVAMTNSNKQQSNKYYSVIKVNLLRVSKINPKLYVDIPTTFYFMIDNLSHLKEKKLMLIKQEKLFLKEYKNKRNQCLAFPKKGVEILDLNIRAFLFFKHCRHSQMFVDFDFTKEENLKEVFDGLINLKNIQGRMNHLRSLYLKSLLESSRFFHENENRLIKKYLPALYSNKMNLIYKEKLETAIWFKFENIFLEFENLIYHKDVFIKLNEHLRQSLIKQKIKGIEIRIYNQGNVVKEMNRILLNYTAKTNSDLIKEAEDLRVGYIFYGIKNKICDCTREMIESHQIFKKIRTNFNNNYNNSHSLINAEKTDNNLNNNKNQCINLIGIDYVGFEDDPFIGARNFFHNAIQNVTNKVGSPNKNYTLIHKEEHQYDNFFEKLFLNLKANSDLPLFYHAGETKYFPECPVDDDYFDNNYINDNLFHAILLPNVKRIGHGFAAIKNDLLLEIMRKKNIPLEFSPLSNQDLFYYKVEDNPISYLIKKGYPITINSDDPGMFGYEGVTMDWFYLIMNTDLKPGDMYLLVKNSMVYSGLNLEKEEFDLILSNIQKDFLKFFEELN